MTNDKNAQRWVGRILSVMILREVSLGLERLFDSALSLICHLSFVIFSSPGTGAPYQSFRVRGKPLRPSSGLTSKAW
jgi:hypothetical protein